MGNTFPFARGGVYMPWKECWVVDERLRFVARLLDGEAMTDVCREFGISRKTGYKIFDRYKEHGLEALSDLTRADPARFSGKFIAAAGTANACENARMGESLQKRFQMPQRHAVSVRKLLCVGRA
jgi:transposase